MALSELAILARAATGFGLSYALGFERQLRGSLAGTRTFALVGTSAAVVSAVVSGTSPAAVAGLVTGIGFIGAGVVFKGRTGSVHGITTAATIFAIAGVGIVVGYGHLLIGLLITLAYLGLLEVPHLRLLRVLDAQTYAGRVDDDPELRRRDPSTAADEPGNS